MLENFDKWCFTYPHPMPSASWNDRAALVLPYRWPGHLPITISFLDDDDGLAQQVEQVARQWIGVRRANLRFAFLFNRNDTQIRISFKRKGSWSMLGTSCTQNRNLTEPTMNFGWLNARASPEEFEAVVLHEFGHALGLVHEHQNPMNSIQWNRQEVYRDLDGQWDRATIENNVFAAVAAAGAAATPFDATSVMTYPIKKSWTTNGFSCHLNAKLSPTDVQFIRNIYP